MSLYTEARANDIDVRATIYTRARHYYYIGAHVNIKPLPGREFGPKEVTPATFFPRVSQPFVGLAAPISNQVNHVGMCSAIHSLTSMQLRKQQGLGCAKGTKITGGEEQGRQNICRAHVFATSPIRSKPVRARKPVLRVQRRDESRRRERRARVQHQWPTGGSPTQG